MEESKQPNKVLIGIIVAVVLVAVTAVVVMLSQQQTNKSTDTPQTASNQSTSSNNSTTVATGEYKDGSYEGTGSYKTPGGNEEVTVKVTLKDGVIEAVDMERDPTTREAEEYQGKFVSGYKALVVGKNIDEVQLSRVAGSSLTSGGFNRALDQIKSDAKA